MKKNELKEIIKECVLEALKPTLSAVLSAHIGDIFSDGDIQRYILEMHPDFEDSDRINGDYVLVNVPVTDIAPSEWELFGDKIDMFKNKQTPFPPIVLDRNLSFIDGGHRHHAALERGDRTILALMPKQIAYRWFKK